jgi:hypothetical protein
MTQTIHIKASGGVDFYQQIATFAYGSYVLHGSGAVIVTEFRLGIDREGRAEQKNPGTRRTWVEGDLAYTPFSQEAELTEEVIEQINHYDPELQCVFAMVDSEGKATVLTLNAAEHMGSTPKMLYEEMSSGLRLTEGLVSENEEHIAISYGKVHTDEHPFPTVARVSAPRDGVINLEFLIDDSTTHDAETMADVRRRVHWLFIEKGEANPWAYAQYHCTTAANIYSRVHCGWVPGSDAPKKNFEELGV